MFVRVVSLSQPSRDLLYVTGSDEISGQMLLASFTSLIRNLNPNKATGSDEIS